MLRCFQALLHHGPSIGEKRFVQPNNIIEEGMFNSTPSIDSTKSTSSSIDMSNNQSYNLYESSNIINYFLDSFLKKYFPKLAMTTLAKDTCASSSTSNMEIVTIYELIDNRE